MAKFKPINHIEIGKYPYSLIPKIYKVKSKELEEHGHVIGASKAGKSRFLAKLYIQWLQAGYSVILLDPQGGLAKLILSHLVEMGYFETPGAFERLTYLDLAGAEELGLFMPFNVLKQDVLGGDGKLKPKPVHQVGSHILDACHRAWPELAQGAAIFDTLLPDAVQLLYNNNYPLVALDQLLDNERFRMEMLEKEADPFLVQSFQGNYNEFKGVEQKVYAGSVKRRARELTRLPILRYGLGQSGNLLNFTKLMQENKSLIVNLGGLEDIAVSLIGCLITTGVEYAARARGRLPEGSTFPITILMADEFTMFSDKSETGFAHGLSLTRQFGLYWVMAHQTWGQLSPRMRSAVQNAGWEAIFKEGPEDSDFSAPYVTTFDPNQIKHEVDDPKAAERTHPQFMSLPEQNKLVSQDIRDMPRRHFKYRSPMGEVVDLITTDMPDAKVDREELGVIKRYYLSNCFRPQEEIESEIYAFTKGWQEPKKSDKPAFMSYIETEDTN